MAQAWHYVDYHDHHDKHDGNGHDVYYYGADVFHHVYHYRTDHFHDVYHYGTNLYYDVNGFRHDDLQRRCRRRRAQIRL